MSKRNLGVVLALMLLVVAPACGHKKARFESGAVTGSSESGGKGLVAEVVWAKHQKAGIDVFMKLTNNYTHGISFKKNAVHLSMEGEAGGFKKSNFSGDMAAGVSESEVTSFIFSKGQKATTATLTLEPVFAEDAEGTATKKKISTVTVQIPLDK